MSIVSSLPYWARMMFYVLEDDFFLNGKSQIFWFFLFKFFLKILAISHENVKKNKHVTC